MPWASRAAYSACSSIQTNEKAPLTVGSSRSAVDIATLALHGAPPGVRWNYDRSELVADGIVHIFRMATKEVLTFSQHFACPTCGMSFQDLAPRNFSFNSPYGACQACDGLGTRYEVDPQLVVPAPDLPVDEGAIAPCVLDFDDSAFHRVSSLFWCLIVSRFTPRSQDFQSRVAS